MYYTDTKDYAMDSIKIIEDVLQDLAKYSAEHGDIAFDEIADMEIDLMKTKLVLQESEVKKRV